MSSIVLWGACRCHEEQRKSDSGEEYAAGSGPMYRFSLSSDGSLRCVRTRSLDPWATMPKRTTQQWRRDER
jgi:hypothetical protein